MGVERSERALKAADLIVWVKDLVLDWPDSASSSFDSEALWVRNKTDLGDFQESEAFETLDISTTNEQGIPELLNAIEAIVAQRFTETESQGVLRMRHAECLEQVIDHLNRGVRMLSSSGFDAEIVGEEMRLALRSLGRIAGRVDIDDLLDVIFGEFCVGK